MALVAPWPSIFAFDFGRYLVAAAIVSGVIAAMPQRFLDLRRIRARLPKLKQRRREFRHSVSTALVFSIIGMGIYYGVEFGIFRVYSEIAEYGWLYGMASLVLIVAAHDAYFYWMHRWMHRPSMFRRVHRTHHLSVAPTQWAAYSFSIREALAQAAFLPAYLLIVPTHEIVLFMWMAHQILRNVVGHCGIELVPKAWLATWWGRWITTTLHHDMHHEHGRCNYGLYFTWWDHWCGTEHPEYSRRMKELIAVLDRATDVQSW
ncbi:sterol desaturase/sphingolipid hydroxylase (fatty acid hydroxylase superfamily) [Povalibacter uvarum]|uniref:Sterol desaturase/sphingolipid hydroxylase (Fatty acid hydroxylase superfamily) n=1 Tax=Povalibacter uvarum TaxID=732238 RepID=A0A841HSZ1_9GAMM|nr:sterol desaturase family protein [Povalibacter uvarum]MBB6094975.1 sterol desaturase/sphingolipid hydroxylase (fatty acid hydroxylase superfamily) [Povalibacter uvarum]